ncbi:hypothetical protein [Pontibacillus marinus]|uniref:Uncharacterized protein n=1 Tax=Pontibacillus marinus BH030004 = DSM 16465 TaxID=1385511 RepID=A0A0A5FYN4_9BACI|nr:hypothetical protein [Pontibacillus marinus]KGX85926.1 hypothetical protein N783_13115 [Pontibacillus marinus BH030004 = DSM 16465]
MFNREKQLLKWGETRKMGKWKYVFLYGVFMGGTFYFIFSILLNTIFNTYYSLLVLLIEAVPFGIILGIATWIMSERKYKKYRLLNK